MFHCSTAAARAGAVFWPKSPAPKTNQHSILLSLRITLCHLDKRRTLIAQLLPRRKSCSAPPRPMTAAGGAAEMADIHPVQQFLMRVSVTWVNTLGQSGDVIFKMEKTRPWCLICILKKLKKVLHCPPVNRAPHLISNHEEEGTERKMMRAMLS